MKKLCILFILISCLFLISCKNTISYQLRNNSDYDVILIDSNNVNYPSYYLKAHSWIAIEHTNSGKFILFNNTNPIEVVNNYTFSVVKELNFYNIKIKNNTSKAFQLKILNSTYISLNIFSIIPNQDSEIKIYAKTLPLFELFENNIKYNNFILNDDTLVIY